MWDSGRDRSGDLAQADSAIGSFASQPTLSDPISPPTALMASAPVQAAPVAAIGDWFSQNFRDAGVANVVRQAYNQDGMISRADAITLFRSIEADGVVNANEYQDCQTFVQKARALKMPEYVEVLSAKVVGHNIANTLFLGTPLGDLQAGSSGAQLERLLDKWFFGSDHPIGVIAPTNAYAERKINYTFATGSLFGTDNRFDVTDIQQGVLGDCYFLAALAATTAYNPNAIQNMWIDNGDSTFTVRLYQQKDGNVTGVDYVTVDRYLPGSVSMSGTNQRFAYYDNQTVGLWVALAEKAYAQFAEEQGSQRPPAADGYVYNSYGSIEAGLAFRVMPAISGRNGGYYSPASYQGVLGGGRLGEMLTINQVAQVLASGWALTLGTLGNSDREIDPSTGIVGGHEYAIYGADPAQGTLWLYNPWGDNRYDTGDSNGYKLISYSDVSRLGLEIGIG